MEKMEIMYTVLAVFEKPYSFDDEKGVHREGKTKKIALLRVENGVAVDVEICKVSSAAPPINIGARGSGILYDKYTRFVRFC